MPEQIFEAFIRWFIQNKGELLTEIIPIYTLSAAIATWTVMFLSDSQVCRLILSRTAFPLRFVRNKAAIHLLVILKYN